MFFKQNINTIIALVGVAAVGIGASYLIIRVAGATELSFVSTEQSIIFTAEFQRGGRDRAIE